MLRQRWSCCYCTGVLRLCPRLMLSVRRRTAQEQAAEIGRLRGELGQDESDLERATAELVEAEAVTRQL